MLGETNALLFTGTYEHAIDAKQRLAIPADVRDRLVPDTDGRAFYAVVQEGPTLCLYTERGFEKRAEQLDQSDLPPEQVLEYERIFFALARRVELDKQGRIRLPEQLLKMTDLDRDVVLIGVKDHLELHDRSSYYQRMSRMLEEKPELLMNPRRVIGHRAKESQ
jgi:MraZ protein